MCLQGTYRRVCYGPSGMSTDAHVVRLNADDIAESWEQNNTIVYLSPTTLMRALRVYNGSVYLPEGDSAIYGSVRVQRRWDTDQECLIRASCTERNEKRWSPGLCETMLLVAVVFWGNLPDTSTTISRSILISSTLWSLLFLLVFPSRIMSTVAKRKCIA